MNWIKGIGGAILAAGAMFLAVMAVASASRQKGLSEKWQKTAVDEKEKNVSDSVKKANQALTQAKLANNRASEAKENARKKLDAIGRKDPELAAVVSGWKSSRLRNPSG